MRRYLNVLVLISLPAVLLIPGCGGPEFVPVSGQVTLDGNPLPGVHVTFDASEGEVAYSAQATTDQQGEFVLATNEEQGAIVGQHRVMLTTLSPDDYGDERAQLPVDKVPARYQDGNLTMEVPPAGTDAADFALKSR